MTIRVVCKCGKRLKASDEHAGRKAKCSRCGTLLVIENTDSTDLPPELSTPPDPLPLEMESPASSDSPLQGPPNELPSITTAQDSVTKVRPKFSGLSGYKIINIIIPLVIIVAIVIRAEATKWDDNQSIESLITIANESNSNKKKSRAVETLCDRIDEALPIVLDDLLKSASTTNPNPPSIPEIAGYNALALTGVFIKTLYFPGGSYTVLSQNGPQAVPEIIKVRRRLKGSKGYGTCSALLKSLQDEYIKGKHRAQYDALKEHGDPDVVKWINETIEKVYN